jgi:hypothetical protein
MIFVWELRHASCVEHRTSYERPESVPTPPLRLGPSFYFLISGLRLKWPPDFGPSVRCEGSCSVAPMEQGMTKSHMKFNATFKAKITLEARARRFSSWQCGHACIRTRSTYGRSRFSTMSRASSRAGRADRTRDGEALHQDRPADCRTGFPGQLARAMIALGQIRQNLSPTKPCVVG